MNTYDRIDAFKEDLTAWRHDLHMNPETGFEEVRTAEIVAKKLESFGIAVHRGLARTGVVGTLKAGTGNRAIGLRADMDALDLQEKNEFAHRSRVPGKMHGCGHDGHTIMLLGAARYLAETKNFDGTVHFIFQPAEEGQGGGREMCEDGLFEKFPVEAVYGLHNAPGLEVGKAIAMTGPAMAAADLFEIKVRGIGAHGAYPHKGVDPIVVGSELVLALQSIVSRNTDPLEAAVISVTKFNGGFATNVIPEDVTLAGTTRSFSLKVQEMIEARMRRVCEGVALAHGAEIVLNYKRNFPPVINTPDETENAAKALSEVLGPDNVIRNAPPRMGSEDFAWMLLQRPGSYIFLGNGEAGAMVHNPRYDFNDTILPIGASYWAKLVETNLAAR